MKGKVHLGRFSMEAPDVHVPFAREIASRAGPAMNCCSKGHPPSRLTSLLDVRLACQAGHTPEVRPRFGTPCVVDPGRPDGM